MTIGSTYTCQSLGCPFEKVAAKPLLITHAYSRSLESSRPIRHDHLSQAPDLLNKLALPVMMHVGIWTEENATVDEPTPESRPYFGVSNSE